MLIGIIVTGHGNFASGLASSIEVIAGKQDKFEAIDFPIGSTNTELAKQLQEAVDRLNCSDIIFCTIRHQLLYFAGAVEQAVFGM